MSKKVSEVRPVVGIIEATGAFTTKIQGKKAQTTYSTIRLADGENKTIFMDGVNVHRRVNTYVEPGSRGTFFFWKKRKFVWLFAYKAPDGTLVHDLDGADITARLCRIGAFIFLGLPLYWVLSSKGYNGGIFGRGASIGEARMVVLMLSSPIIITGLLCWWGARVATRNVKMLRETLESDRP